MTPRALVVRLRRELRQVADPSRASGMQAYMKSAMPFHGVPMPLLRQTCRELFAELELPSSAAWQQLTIGLWRAARYREERHAALFLAADRRARSFQTPDVMPMYEEMVVTGAWWDYVDEIATHRVSAILRSHPRPIARLMRRWSRDGNLWKRRVSILCQVPLKEDTNLDLLYACIEPSLGSKEFFLQKAIGWALRQHAWTDAREVARYVRANRDRLAPLTRREALKNAGGRSRSRSRSG
jgi:3-methyladenine DNA glycosylase AlkD